MAQPGGLAMASSSAMSAASCGRRRVSWRSLDHDGETADDHEANIRARERRKQFFVHAARE